LGWSGKQKTSRHQKLAAETQSMIRNILNLVMLLCILVVMDHRFTGNAVHEILGVLIFLLFIMHNALNRQVRVKYFLGRVQFIYTPSYITAYEINFRKP
jgi:hypothetical protein